jgi:hypothetical protein
MTKSIRTQSKWQKLFKNQKQEHKITFRRRKGGGGADEDKNFKLSQNEKAEKFSNVTTVR